MVKLFQSESNNIIKTNEKIKENNYTNDVSNKSFIKRVNIMLTALLVAGVTSVYAVSNNAGTNDTGTDKTQIQALQDKVDKLSEKIVDLNTGIISMRSDIALTLKNSDKLYGQLNGVDFTSLSNNVVNLTNSIKNGNSGSGNTGNTGNTGGTGSGTGNTGNTGGSGTGGQGGTNPNPSPDPVQETKAQVQSKIDAENQRHTAKMKEIEDWHTEWTNEYSKELADAKAKYPYYTDYKGVNADDLEKQWRAAYQEYGKDNSAENLKKYQDLHNQWVEADRLQVAHYAVYAPIFNQQQIEIKYTQDISEENKLHDKNIQDLNNEMAKAV